MIRGRMAVTKAFVILPYTLLENIHKTLLPFKNLTGTLDTPRPEAERHLKKKPGKFDSNMNPLIPTATIAREMLMGTIETT